VVIGDLRVLRSEVTVHQYRACLDAGDCGWPGHGWDELGEDDRSQDDMPVTQVSIEDARAFCAWQDGGRLPSEAEWEYLARSRGQDRLYPWGDDEPSRDHAVHDWSLGWLYPVLSWRVCERPDGDTDQGLCDMAGSVSELVEDCYHDGYEVEDWDGVVVRAPDDGTPWTELCDGDGVVRGGSWDSGSHDELRASRRDRIEDPWDGRSSIGFRCVR